MDLYESIVQLRAEGRRGAMATIINVRGSIPAYETAKMLVRDDGTIVGTIGGGCVEADVWQAAKQVMQDEKPQTLTFHLNQDPRYDNGLVCGGTLEVFVEPIVPTPLLYIFGAGHVSQCLYQTARLAGFAITVIDDREEYANRERFPDARDIYADDYERICTQLAPTENAFLVIVTRGHKDDMKILRWAVETPARFIGMIGSERKFLAIRKAFEEDGIPPQKLDRVFSPVGIDIGAITPAEIAIAVVAEMIAARRKCKSDLPHLAWTKKKSSVSSEQPETAEEK